MRRSVEFIAGLLAGPGPALVTSDDVSGPHGPALCVWQRYGFLATEPEPIRVASCPHCREGVPIDVGGRLLCGHCLSDVDPQRRSAWRCDVPAFLTWLGRELHLEGDVRPVDGDAWQLGTLTEGDVATEYFFCRTRPTGRALSRLAAYRNAVLLRPLPTADVVDGYRGQSFCLLDVLTMTADGLSVTGVRQGRAADGAVRFDAGSGALRVGGDLAGEVPVGSKEFHLLACLAESIDRFVAYADLKHDVLSRSGSRDTTEEATFCQKLKGRIKRKWVPGIDRLIATTNKGDGYRLRGDVDLSAYRRELASLNPVRTAPDGRSIDRPTKSPRGPRDQTSSVSQ